MRLLGVQASGLVSAGAEQLALLRGERWGDVERAVDRIEHRFGRGAASPPRCSTARGGVIATIMKVPRRSVLLSA